MFNDSSSTVLGLGSGLAPGQGLGPEDVDFINGSTEEGPGLAPGPRLGSGPGLGPGQGLGQGLGDDVREHIVGVGSVGSVGSVDVDDARDGNGEGSILPPPSPGGQGLAPGQGLGQELAPGQGLAPGSELAPALGQGLAPGLAPLSRPRLVLVHCAMGVSRSPGSTISPYVSSFLSFLAFISPFTLLPPLL